MSTERLGAVESRFADLIWQYAPLPSGQLVKLCECELGWKKPTTYNVLRKLCERGLFQNENAVVLARVTREEFYAQQGRTLVDEAFGGSLPAFFAAFTKKKALSQTEIAEIQRMIDAMGEEG